MYIVYLVKWYDPSGQIRTLRVPKDKEKAQRFHDKLLCEWGRRVWIEEEIINI